MKKSNLIKWFLTLAGVFLIGIAGYMLIEGFTFIEAFYMTAITVSTVGYGEVHQLSNTGRIFTTFLVFAGIGTAAGFATQTAAFFIEYQMKGLFGRKKMQKKINTLKEHYIVCGYGRIGSVICNNLAENHIRFVVIEGDENRAKRSEEAGFFTVKGNAVEDTFLIEAGIKRAAGIISCLTGDSDNLFVSLASRELNREIYIISRATDPTVEKRILRAGADTVVYPLQLGGEQIARLVAGHTTRSNKSGTLEEIPSGIMGYSLKIYHHFQNQPLSVAQIVKNNHADEALTVFFSDGSELTRPADNTTIKKDSRILLLVRNEPISSSDKNNASQTNEPLVWKQGYSLGIPPIDKEHKILFQLTDELMKAVDRRSENKTLFYVLDRLIDYTAVHFKNEEKLMEEAGYKNLEDHRKEHRRLLKKVKELSGNREAILADNVADFLLVWIRDHILDEDRKYADQVKELRKANKDKE